MKKFLLIAVLVVSANIAFAQDKYEFMAINYVTNLSGSGGEINISIDGKEFLTENVVLQKGSKSFYNANPLLSKVAEYQDKGWETVNLNTSPTVSFILHSAYLRKKKN
jgi:hypothetical protein